MITSPPFPGERVPCNGNTLVSYHTEARLAEAGVFYPITPSTEMGELFQQSYAEGRCNVFGRPLLAIECEGEHAAQGGAIAAGATGRRVVNFTSGQGLVYGLEQYYHAPGKLSSMVVEVAARALTRHALNVHCGHDDIYAALDTGWIMLMAKDAQQAADQAIIARKVAELSLNPAINIQDGFLTSHLDRSFYRAEAELIRRFLGAPEDIIECPTPSQRLLFGPTRRRIPRGIDLCHPALLGPVQNQEHYMNGVVARRNHFAEPILDFLRQAYEEFARLTGRRYGLVSPYRCEDADTIFVALGSAAENLEAAVDHLRETRQARVGLLHINALRPFPAAEVVGCLKGATRVIVLERTDEPLAVDQPLGRDIRAAFSRERAPQPDFFSGVYGLGSRDFRPEGSIGAFEFAAGGRARQDGRRAADGERYFLVGVDHPYAVRADETPSLLPKDAIAVRFHSIGGWGAIATGKNLAGIIGDLSDRIAQERSLRDAWGRAAELLHISANPKYGSEKKGAPTAYYLVAAPQRVRVNCDLRHVDVVLCCDPKAFTHTDPLEGLVRGGCFIWESDETPEAAWSRIPRARRRFILEQEIQVYILPGFRIAADATDRADLQQRMQGNAFLGAFFRVSPFLSRFGIAQDLYEKVAEKQYRKKFGRQGEGVVQSNLEVMRQGWGRVREIVYGGVEDEDRSSMRGAPLSPLDGEALACGACPRPCEQEERAPWQSRAAFDAEFRAGLGYHQPASALAATGVMAAATGEGASKYVARREVPVLLPERCTQCLDCVAVCPDTALPNTTQGPEVILRAAIDHYVPEGAAREHLRAELPGLVERVREGLVAHIKKDGAPSLATLVAEALPRDFDGQGRSRLLAILKTLPLAYARASSVFEQLEKKTPGSGGLFGLFVSDLCKGCGACVEACGDKQALVMERDGEAQHERMTSARRFLDLLPETPARFLGKYDGDDPRSSRPAALRNHLMLRRNYQALVSGDGACAGCGEKSVLRAVTSITEAYMRPLYHAKAARLEAKAKALDQDGRARLVELRGRSSEGYERWRRAVQVLVMGLGGEDEKDTDARLAAEPPLSDALLLGALTAVLRRDAFAHRDLQAVDGRLPEGMAVMAMGAHTGCNTVFGSTPPHNPHPYPWMNSLFQDGVTVAWMFGESFMVDHARRSVLPERLADLLLDPHGRGLDRETYDRLRHFSDAWMTEAEIAELPKAWAVGGDGGMGDIGFQNVSKVVLQNRPNVKVLLLDTQVYSNTGGQNSDASPQPGGADMNVYGAASQGKLTEQKSPALSFLLGHGSPFVAQISLANAARFYQALLDGLAYRGTAFFQCHCPCMPEHGIGDDAGLRQAQRARDARGLPEFIHRPGAAESWAAALDLKGNPMPTRDWWEARRSDGSTYAYTPAHWCATEARFRNHFRPASEGQRGVDLVAFLEHITQDDVVQRRHLDPTHQSYVPDFGVAIEVDGDEPGGVRRLLLSRAMTLFCVERRKNWRLLQQLAGLANPDRQRQEEALRGRAGVREDAPA